MTIITKKILIFFNLVGLSSLIYLFFNSLNKAIAYEDSFALLKSQEENIFYWFFIPHNGHIMAVSKILSTIMVFFSFNQTTFFITLVMFLLRVKNSRLLHF